MSSPGKKKILVSIAAITLVSVSTLGALLLSDMPSDQQFDARSAEIVKQINSLGTTLKPGGIGMIVIPDCDADELVLLPAYCDEVLLRKHFVNHSSSVVDVLSTLSRDERRCPALIWLRDGKIVSINPMRITVGMNVSLQSWPLDGRRRIKVAKELQSPNTFLSVTLLPDGAGNSGHENVSH